MAEVDVSGADGLPEATVAALVRAALREEGAAVGRVSVSFVAPEVITGFNRTHRDKDRPTDVLSYPFDGSFPHGPGGEVVVCPEVVTRYAVRDGRDRTEALRETIVHGVLHLLGYTDDTDRGAARMADRTAAILTGAR